MRLSLPLSFWRKLVYFVAIFALPAAFGARAAFYAEPLSDIMGPAVTIVVYFLAMGKILRERAVTGPDNSRLGGPGPQWGPSRTDRAGRRDW